jgi:hypothetical protein
MRELAVSHGKVCDRAGLRRDDLRRALRQR